MRTAILLSTALLLLAPLALAAEPLSPAAQTALLERLQPSFVHVEVTLQYDKGEEPSGLVTGERCPSCGGYHRREIGSSLIAQERPLELTGYLIAPTLVLVADPGIHPRFVERIAVAAGENPVTARPLRYPQKAPGLLLQLESPLPGAAPLAFSADASGPYYVVSHTLGNTRWTTTVQPVRENVVLSDCGRRVTQAGAAGVLVTADGTPVGLTLTGELPIDGSWKGSPADWPALTAEQYEALLARVETTARSAILPATLKFRSPRQDRAASPWSPRYRMGEDEDAPEKHVVALLVDERTLLVSALLSPAVTARLEQVVVTLPDGTKRTAEFGHSLRDYGVFTATLSEPLEGALRIDTDDVRRWRDELLVAVNIVLYGESHLMRFVHTRFGGFEFGPKRRVFPDGIGQAAFVFSPDGVLIAGPVAKRERLEENYRWRSNERTLMPYAYVTSQLGDLATHADPSIVPLSQEEESRIAWLGVELQDLDRDLARVHNVSELTQDGQTGALVSFVYPGSPAAAAGIEPGAILLRVHSPDHPRPVPVRGDESFDFGFPWAQLDEVPEMYFEQIPAPWPSAQSALNTALTELGFGRKFELEMVVDGEVVRKPFEVVESPPHYDTAARHKSEPLGLTVRNVTYEVRRYLQADADDPGVIIGKIEPGSKASVSGLKPYELITHVNEEPVQNVGDFERLVTAGAGEELRLGVKRMTRSRIVKIRTDAPAVAVTEAVTRWITADPADEDDDDDADDENEDE